MKCRNSDEKSTRSEDMSSPSTGNIIDLEVFRSQFALECADCYCANFSVVNDRKLGLLVVCDGCHIVTGRLVTEDEG